MTPSVSGGVPEYCHDPRQMQRYLDKAVEHGHGHKAESVDCDAWISPYCC